MLIFLLFNLSYQSTRIRSKESETHKMQFHDSEIKIQHKQQGVYLLNLSNAYDVQLYREDDSEESDPIETPQLSLNNLDLEVLDFEDQCYGFPKHPQLKELLQYNLHNTTEDSYYTDMVTLAEYSNLFLMTQELLLIQIKLRCGEATWVVHESNTVYDLKQLLNISKENVIANALFSCPQQRFNCLIVTPYGGFWIQKFADFDSLTISYIPEFESKLMKRKAVKFLYTYYDLLAVAVGEEGVDLYIYEGSIYERQIKYIYTITKEFESEINIIGVEIIENKLYCLDEIDGVYIFNISNITSPKLLMQIYIQRTVAFDVYEQTVMVVAQTPNKIEYILEIFIDLNTDTYYVNRVYVEDYSFRDIQIRTNFAFLIGEQKNLIIRHSIFNGFVQNSQKLVNSFYTEQLVRFDVYSITEEPSQIRYKESAFLVGLSRQKIFIWKYYNFDAFVVCSYNKRQEQKFLIKTNSTCQENETRENLYQQCQSKHQLEVQVSGPLIISESITILVISLIILIVLLCIIGLIVCIRWRRLLKEMEAKKYHIAQMSRYGHLQVSQQNDI